MMLGKLGVWTAFDDMRAAESAELAKRIEQWGYRTVWMPEGFGRDVLTHSAYLLANTSSLIVATGIANIYARDPMAMAASQKGLNEQSGGRFLLGVGVSHEPIVSGARKHAYGKPVETMQSYLTDMQTATYMAPQPAEKPKTIVAALGPKMLALSRDLADGAHPYNVSPKHTAEARNILGKGKLLCVEQMVICETDAVRARNIARRTLAMYLTLPNYLNNWRRQGFNEQDFANGGSDRLIDDVVAWGTEGSIVARIEQHWDAGADHVCIQAIDPNQSLDTKGFMKTDQGLLGRLAKYCRS
jgi:probable F420-dependent oxidoreductase